MADTSKHWKVEKKIFRCDSVLAFGVDSRFGATVIWMACVLSLRFANMDVLLDYGCVWRAGYLNCPSISFLFPLGTGLATFSF